MELCTTRHARTPVAASSIATDANSENTLSGLFREHFDVADLFKDLMVSTRALVGGKPVKLVELMGGSISLASRWEEGTIVEVRLPLGPGRAERAPGRELTARSRA